MRYKVNPLIYAANEKFKNTIRFSVEFYEEVDSDALHYAVLQVQKRFPYFSVKIEKNGENFILAENNQPYVIIADENPVCLNSPSSNGHLLAFAYKGRTVWVDISHFICDGKGLAPLVKTLTYYYVERRYGNSGIDTKGIRLVTDIIEEEEYACPFPDTPIPNENCISKDQKTYEPFHFEDAFFDDGGSYAYNLQIQQQSMIEYCKDNNGSPVSFVSVMLYKTFMDLIPEAEKDIVFTIPHEYRKVLRRPLSHDSLTRVFPVSLVPGDRNKSDKLLNASIRSQIAAGSDESLDIDSINGMLQLDAYMQSLTLEGKKQTMRGLTAGSLAKNTFFVSYTGNISWCGMEQYIRDVHLYAGENDRHQSISLELFTLGDRFSICIMQPGKNPVFIQKLMQNISDCGIDCKLMSEERFHLADYKLP